MHKVVSSPLVNNVVEVIELLLMVVGIKLERLELRSVDVDTGIIDVELEETVVFWAVPVVKPTDPVEEVICDVEAAI